MNIYNKLSLLFSYEPPAQASSSSHMIHTTPLCDFRARTKLVEFNGATAFTYAVAPEAILRTKLLHATAVSRCCCLILPDS